MSNVANADMLRALHELEEDVEDIERRYDAATSKGDWKQVDILSADRKRAMAALNDHMRAVRRS